VRAAIEAAGARLRFLPPYSPDFNPIEMAFAKLKAFLRAARPRTFDQVTALTAAALALFTAGRMSELRPTLRLSFRCATVKNALSFRNAPAAATEAPRQGEGHLAQQRASSNVITGAAGRRRGRGRRPLQSAADADGVEFSEREPEGTLPPGARARTTVGTTSPTRVSRSQ
jgi:hypothetical protein